MADVSWVKLKTEMFSDDKIRLIESMPEADGILVIWIKLLCQAGKTNANGYIFLNDNVPFTPPMLATLFNRPLPVIEFALKTLRDFEMISINEKGMIAIENWVKHQNAEGLDKIREQTKNRVQKFREKQKLLPSNTKTKNTDIDKEECVSVTLHETLQEEDQIQTIWIKSFGRTPKIPEREETEKQLKQFGYDKTLRLYKDAVNSGVKIIRTLVEHTDSNGNFIPFAKSFNNQTNGCDTTPAAHQYL